MNWRIYNSFGCFVAENNFGLQIWSRSKREILDTIAMIGGVA